MGETAAAPAPRRGIGKNTILVVVACAILSLLYVSSETSFLPENGSTFDKLESTATESESTQQQNHSNGNANKTVCNVFSGHTHRSSPQQQNQEQGYAYTDNLSGSTVWKSFRGKILKASHKYTPSLRGDNAGNNSALGKWIDDIFEFHTEYRLRKTRVHPPDPHAIHKLLQVIENRMTHLENDGDAATNTTNSKEPPPPLRIAVFGGSVTKGVNCPSTPMGRISEFCDWPSMLEKVVNDVFFGGKMVVSVSNGGIGGTSAGTGALLMEHGLLPTKASPHIVMSSYAPNQPSFGYDQIYKGDSSFIQAAKALRPCDDHLPMVVMADHIVGSKDLALANMVSGIYASLAKWFDIMALDETNVALHEVVQNYQNDTAIELFAGAKYNVHLGYGFHLSMVWTTLFNFLDAFVDNCNDFHGIIPTTTSTGDDISNAKPHQIGFENTPSLKHLPTLNKDTTEIEKVVDTWNKKYEEQTSQCSKNPSFETTKHANFAFLVFAGGVNTQEDLRNVLKPFLQSKKGWEVTGDIRRNPRVGWYANSTDANFQLKIPVTKVSRKLVVSFMKSYGPGWVGSKLQVKIEIQRAKGTKDTKKFFLHGSHSSPTSQHRLEYTSLPEAPAAPGDVIILTFTMVGRGSKFKINGLFI